MISEQTLNEITRRLVDKFHPVAIILFGSHARGTADEKSDVDLLVIRELGPGEKRSDVWLAMDHALAGLDIAPDIVVITPREYHVDSQIPGQVARYASLEGRSLYDRAA